MLHGARHKGNYKSFETTFMLTGNISNCFIFRHFFVRNQNRSKFFASNVAVGILVFFKITVCVSKFIEYLYIIVFYSYDQVGG